MSDETEAAEKVLAEARAARDEAGALRKELETFLERVTAIEAGFEQQVYEAEDALTAAFMREHQERQRGNPDGSVFRDS